MQNEVIEIKQKNMYVPICITQTICITLIFITIIITKFFFPNTFIKLENWCYNNLLEHTHAMLDYNEEYTGEI